MRNLKNSQNKDWLVIMLSLSILWDITALLLSFLIYHGIIWGPSHFIGNPNKFQIYTGLYALFGYVELKDVPQSIWAFRIIFWSGVFSIISTIVKVSQLAKARKTRNV